MRRDDDRLTPVEQRFVDFRPTTREYQVLDMTRALPTGSYYWSLPREFLGERVRLSSDKRDAVKHVIKATSFISHLYQKAKFLYPYKGRLVVVNVLCDKPVVNL